MMAITPMLIVCDPPNGVFLAQRYLTTFEEKRHQLQSDPDYLEDPQLQKLVDFALDHGMDLREFQSYVIELHQHFAMAMFDDELIQELIEEREHADMHDLIEIIKWFNASNPTFEVLSVVPIDLKGTMGFVVRTIVNGVA